MVLKGVEKISDARNTDAKFDILPIKVPYTTIQLDNEFTIAEEENQKEKAKQRDSKQQHSKK